MKMCFYRWGIGKNGERDANPRFSAADEVLHSSELFLVFFCCCVVEEKWKFCCYLWKKWIKIIFGEEPLDLGRQISRFSCLQTWFGFVIYRRDWDSCVFVS